MPYGMEDVLGDLDASFASMQRNLDQMSDFAAMLNELSRNVEDAQEAIKTARALGAAANLEPSE